MSFAKSTVVGSAMGEDMEAVEDEGEVGTDGSGGGWVGWWWCSGGRRTPRSRYQVVKLRALAPKVGGPWLLSS
jgi:hypothetical protein